MRTRQMHTPKFILDELTEFVLADEYTTFWTDRTKTKILYQFLSKFRQQFDTDMEFAETISEVLAQFKIQNCNTAPHPGQH
ncbi:hypothetical protein [Dyadobacter sp. 32]|uniref:hypothetical protein n=1 Tax=Dyadobacter sp. 32 TaxID=538966 RepID=UPI0011EBFFE5